jgi:hypothetical protein
MNIRKNLKQLFDQKISTTTKYFLQTLQQMDKALNIFAYCKQII